MTPAVLPIGISSRDAAAVWTRFAGAIGPETLRACYGWVTPPPSRRSMESVWAYYNPVDPACLVGWGSIVKDPTTETYWHASGVFPAYARQGYRQAIRQHLCREAVARGAEAITLVVLDTNPAHLERCHREAQAGSPWQPSGRIWRPAPAQTLFTLLRQDATQFAGDLRTCAYPTLEEIT